MLLKIKNLEFESHKIIDALTEKNKAFFLSQAEELRFKKGSLIFYEEGIPTGVFLLKHGKAKIYKRGFYGKEQIFYIYRRGDLFGYHALLCDESYEDACEAIEDCTVLFINRKKFENLMQETPKLRQLLMQNMSHEFGVLVNTITILAQKNLRERLALYLLLLHRRYEEKGKHKTQINLPREDLANIIGTARESLGRLLKEFKEDNLIRVQGRAIEVIDFEKLAQIAQSKYF
ncbi:MAG: Crp/Fnr family transcriptional regulator [Saprospiraceae bacterium]